VSLRHSSPFPNFFIIGAPKCGTTALYSILRQHPEIYMSPVKEPHYFTFEGDAPAYPGPGGNYFRRVAVTRPRDYLLLFAGAKDHRAIGEASPTYLGSDVAAKRIHKAAPAAKIIVLLRQPAERAYSHYQYLRFHGVETAGSFAEALQQEDIRRAEGWSKILFCRQGGYYFANLSRYYELFPREQIKVYLYEDWNGSPEAVLHDLFNFLGVDEHFVPNIRRSNVTLIPRVHRLNRLAQKPERIRRLLAPIAPALLHAGIIAGLQKLNRRVNLYTPPPIDPDIRKELTEGYREDILELQELIGRDLAHWLGPKAL